MRNAMNNKAYSRCLQRLKWAEDLLRKGEFSRYSREYLILVLFSVKARLEYGHRDLPLELRQRLDEISSTFVTDLDALLSSDKLRQLISELRERLWAVKRLSEDCLLFEDTPEYENKYENKKEQLSEKVQAFLSLWMDLIWFKKGLLNYSKGQFLIDEINGLEQTFKQYFGYFEPVTNVLEEYKKTEVSEDFWWFEEKPVFPEPELYPEIERSLKPAFKNKKLCEYQEMAVLYALGELSQEEEDEFKRHLYTCPSCLQTVLETRFIAYKNGQKGLPVRLKKGMKTFLAKMLEQWGYTLKANGKSFKDDDPSVVRLDEAVIGKDWVFFASYPKKAYALAAQRQEMGLASEGMVIKQGKEGIESIEPLDIRPFYVEWYEDFFEVAGEVEIPEEEIKALKAAIVFEDKLLKPFYLTHENGHFIARFKNVGFAKQGVLKVVVWI